MSSPSAPAEAAVPKAPAAEPAKEPVKADAAPAVPKAAAPAAAPAPKAAAPAVPAGAAAPGGAPAPVEAAAPDVKPAPKNEEGAKTQAVVSKAASLVARPTSSAPAGGHAGVATAAVAGGTGHTPAASKAAGAAPPPTSAAAVITQTGKPVTAAERAEVTGSVLARGPGAKAEAPAAPKAKAPAAAAPAPAPTSAPTSAAPSKPAAAPASVLHIVSASPVPALEATPPGSAPSVGPARAFTAAAAPVLSGEAPKVGPPAVAVGRALAAGLSPVVGGGALPSTSIYKKYQIVFTTSEVAPFSKTGGLGEAMDGLPVALAALGHRVMVISPRYDQYKDAWDTSFWSSVKMGGKEESVHFFHAYKQKVDYVFVDHPTFLERVDGLSGAKLYGPEWGADFADNQARFAYFCKAALVAVSDLSLGGAPYGDRVVIVANDWHSALVPMLITAEREADPTKWKNTKTAFLNHNAVFQGRFELEKDLADIFGVPQKYIDSITFQMPLRVGRLNKKTTCVNTMAAALLYADRVLTVSPSYAKEVATDPEKGVELENLFAKGRVTGILNGVKEGVSPADKGFVTKTQMTCGTYTAATVDVAKAHLKATYRAQNNLPALDGPLMCFIGRLDAQKGYDILLDALVEVLPELDMQMVVVGAGRADLVAQTKAMEKKFPEKFFYAGWMGPERYALLGGCDFTLLPSRWEPCGLVQMEAMRLGTLPIVAPTGGLKDTVTDGVDGLWTDAEMTVESEVHPESVASLAAALRRAVKLHLSQPEKVTEMMRAAMAASAEFTWSNAALQYEVVFEELGAVDVLAEAARASVTLEVDKQVC